MSRLILISEFQPYPSSLDFQNPLCKNGFIGILDRHSDITEFTVNSELAVEKLKKELFNSL